MLPFTIILIGVTTLISYMAFKNPELKHKYMFNAYMVYHRKQWYRLLTGAFLHADWNHLIFNMITLFFFGRNIENFFVFSFGNIGIIYFLLLYVGGAIFSSLPSLFKHKDNEWYNALGASGAVSAVLFTAILINPVGLIYLYFIPIPGILFAVGYLIYSARMSKQSNDNIGHDAHLWGSAFGLIMPLFVDIRIYGIFFREISQYLPF